MTSDHRSHDTPFSPPEASAYLQSEWRLKRGVRTLQSYRRSGSGPKFYRTGNDVRYSRRDLDAWAAEKLGEPISSNSQRSARRLMTAAAAKQG
jgi:hypothetical protein